MLLFWHSAKFGFWPSATRLALGKVPVRPCPVHPSRSPVPFARSAVRPSRFNFFCRVRCGTRQKFAKCSRNGTRQSRLRRKMIGRVHFVECYTRQLLCRVFSELCRVSMALGKAPKSGKALHKHKQKFETPNLPSGCIRRRVRIKVHLTFALTAFVYLPHLLQGSFSLLFQTVCMGEHGRPVDEEGVARGVHACICV